MAKFRLYLDDAVNETSFQYGISVANGSQIVAWQDSPLFENLYPATYVWAVRNKSDLDVRKTGVIVLNPSTEPEYNGTFNSTEIIIPKTTHGLTKIKRWIIKDSQDWTLNNNPNINSTNETFTVYVDSDSLPVKITLS
jgi:hypothetical protein